MNTYIHCMYYCAHTLKVAIDMYMYYSASRYIYSTKLETWGGALEGKHFIP